MTGHWQQLAAVAPSRANLVDLAALACREGLCGWKRRSPGTGGDWASHVYEWSEVSARGLTSRRQQCCRGECLDCPRCPIPQMSLFPGPEVGLRSSAPGMSGYLSCRWPRGAAAERHRHPSPGLRCPLPAIPCMLLCADSNPVICLSNEPSILRMFAVGLPNRSPDTLGFGGRCFHHHETSVSTDQSVHVNLFNYIRGNRRGI